MDKDFAFRLKTARVAREMSQAQLADLVGRDKSAISLLESGKRGASVEFVARLAKALSVREDWLAFEKGDMISQEERAELERPADIFTPKLIPGNELVGDQRDLPVYAAAKGGDGHVIITFDPISYMKMPAVLQGVKGGYGLLLSGESMVPAYRPGETALVNPNLPPMRDEDVILYHTSEMDENEAIIKRLVGYNDREWMLEQYNPHKEFKEFRADWPVCHRVVGKYNTR
ncbi:helix-turn-helix domain-containing protein [Brucella intermedia GD04153]|uniref:Helix-turn-helix domain-containing protein n=1 Tax=Brucella intermedia GD04153 TaxID=2975438 RepID=A0AA42H0C7_9HYPH|nr:helix-turn-helix domain-containing protein [Brucella intermedia]MDH0125462.1 helix-turn-helix domain-containing protein [Brucella intermedia GD04153]